MSERSKATQFKPGVSGNPSGRPKTRSLSKAYRDKLEELVPNDPKGRTFAHVIADAMVLRAAKGDVQAACELADRCEGKVKLAVTEMENEFEGMSVEELEAELARADEHAGRFDSQTPDPRRYQN